CLPVFPASQNSLAPLLLIAALCIVVGATHRPTVGEQFQRAKHGNPVAVTTSSDGGAQCRTRRSRTRRCTKTCGKKAILRRRPRGSPTPPPPAARSRWAVKVVKRARTTNGQSP